MSLKISDIYRPITGQPFRCSDIYREYAPCEALGPYIRCFWSSEENADEAGKSSLVIPDTCTDIIIDTDTGESIFCGINDCPQNAFIKRSKPVSVFAVRFYCHTAVLFSEGGMDGSLNCYLPGEEIFGSFAAELARRVSSEQDICGRIAAAEKFLLERVNLSRENESFMNALYYIISRRGSADVMELSRYTAYSKRQLERIFKTYAGVSPKALSGLIRYQLLWQDILSGGYDPGNAVEKFGYFDQPHMLGEFRKYHGMNPKNALSAAYREAGIPGDQ